MFGNWLTSDITTSPDLIVEVGPPPFARFPVHSSILSLHSGYLRAAIIRSEESPVKNLENIIYLPNITIDQFAPLLTYMYTGFLELNLENIFGVLLATHLLHMPQALELCRNFLSRSQQQQLEQTENYMRQFSAISTVTSTTTPAATTSKVIRPIPSKANSSGVNFISPPTNTLISLVPSHETSFKSIGSLIVDQIAIKSKPENFHHQKSSSSAVQGSPKKSELPILEKPHLNIVKKIPASTQQSTSAKQSNHIQSKKIVVANEENEFSNSDKVIIDIASCDGPVRFRRVLNEAYDVNKNLSTSAIETQDLKNSFKHQSANAKSFHQQMARNINEQILHQQNLVATINSEESENSQQSGNLSSTETYTCVYCKHTFKSQYCYQKHAKRHLNPLNLKNFKCDDSDLESYSEVTSVKKIKITTEEPKKSVAPSNFLLKRDSIKPLDMNVQYYPCKTCGCKFPSYYFVHKHRKLCHPELLEENRPQPEQQTDQNAENQVENLNIDQHSSDNKDSDSMCSINVDEKDSPN